MEMDLAPNEFVTTFEDVKAHEEQVDAQFKELQERLDAEVIAHHTEVDRLTQERDHLADRVVELEKAVNDALARLRLGVNDTADDKLRDWVLYSVEQLDGAL